MKPKVKARAFLITLGVFLISVGVVMFGITIIIRMTGG